MSEDWGPSGGFYRAARRRTKNKEEREELAHFFVEQYPRVSPEAFFDQLLAVWEYELLSQGSEKLDGRAGFLAMHQAGVPTVYMNALSVDCCSEATPASQAPGGLQPYGYGEVIALHAAGVPAEYARAFQHPGRPDAPGIIAIYQDGLPLEYVQTLFE